MIRFLLKRLSQTLIVLFVVSIFAFSLIRLAPGNPALSMLPEGASDQALEEMEKKLGLDKPLYIQYFRYISGILQGDLGTSTAYKVSVNKVISERLPYTAQLTLGTLLLGVVLAIPLGIIAGSNRGKAIDFFAMLFAIIGQSMSAVWLAVLYIFIFSVWLGWLPAMGTGGLKFIILPVLTLGYQMAAAITRVGRSGMIDTLGEDYITAIYAKGIRRWKVNWIYAFKNVLIPVLTLLGLQTGMYLAGAVVVETVFSWSGIGQLTFQAVGNRDYALVQSLVLVSAFLFTMINLFVDIISSFIDPRLKLQ